MFLSCLIFYTTVDIIDVKKDAHIFDTFGFEANGTFNVTFFNEITPELHYAILPIIEFPIEMLIKASASKFCKETPKIVTKIPINETFYFNGTIESKSVYTPIIYSCKSNLTNIQVKQVFENPGSKLDYRWKGGDWAQLSLVIMMSVILVLWVINWIINYKINIKIHYFITASIIFGELYHIMSYLEIRKLEVANQTSLETTLRAFFTVCYNGTLFITLLLTAKGWCIYKEKLQFREFILPILYIIIYMVFNGLHMFADLGRNEIIFSLIMLISIGLFMRELIISINSSNNNLIAHMYVIYQAGINPTTTPVYTKYMIYTIMKYSIIACSVLIITKICVSLFVNIFFWINQFFIDLILGGMCIIMYLLFRLRGQGANYQYQIIVDNEEDDGNPQEIPISELEEVDMSKMKDGTGIVWMEGMKLPTPPVIIENQSKKHEIRIEQYQNSQKEHNSNLSDNEENSNREAFPELQAEKENVSENIFI